MDAIKKYLAEIGRKGGRSRSAAKRAAAKKNIKKTPTHIKSSSTN